MPRRLAITFCGLAVALAACSALPGARPSAPGATGAGSRLSDIIDRGRLRVATPADLPPLSMRSRTGEVIGFEIDLARALAEAMDLEIEIVVTPFPELIPTLERGEVDLVLGGLTMTPERNARVAFAGPYFISGTSLVTRAMDPEDLRDPGRLDDPSHAFAALADSTSAEFVREVFPKARLVLTRDYGEAVDKLIAGEVDAVVADFLACKLAEWRHEDEGLRALGMPFTTEPLGIALPADDPLLLNLVENYLSTLEDTGELTLLKARWLSDGAWLDELP